MRGSSAPKMKYKRSRGQAVIRIRGKGRKNDKTTNNFKTTQT